MEGALRMICHSCCCYGWIGLAGGSLSTRAKVTCASFLGKHLMRLMTDPWLNPLPKLGFRLTQAEVSE